MSANESPMSIDLGREADFSLGILRVRPSSREVLTKDRTEVLEPRVMQVLVALARQRGEVVSRNHLVEECWAGRVVGEDAINRCIAKVRRLADAHGGFTVETIPRVGYRLIEDGYAVERPAAPISAGEVAEVVPLQASPARKRLKMLLLVVALLFGGAIYFGVAQRREANVNRDLRARTLVQVANLVGKDQYGAAFTLALPLLKDERTKSDPRFTELWQQIVLPMRPLISESGATVYFKPYEDVEGGWVEAGTMPFTKLIDAPRGPLRLKVEKPGFRTGYFVIANPGPSLENDPPIPVVFNRPIDKVPLPLAAEGTLPDDVVLVPRTNIPVSLTGWSAGVFGTDQRDMPAFGIGRSEVTNQEFKAFVDAGGYDNPAYWQGLKFEEDGRELSWADARQQFVDSTRRPGPAGWQLSTYPTGQAGLPVGGISWYEAVAYARFRGEELPTIHHWVRAAFAPYDIWYNTAPAVATQSRFSSDGPIPAHDSVGLGPWGTVNMAGNVSEWVWNSAGTGGLALGGAWGDNASLYQMAETERPMQRLPQNGLRLMHSLSGTPVSNELLQPIRLLFDNNATWKREPVSDEAFEAMRFQFATAHVKPINVSVQEIQQSPVWVVEEVILEFQGAANATIYIARPRIHHSPLQPIIYGPPGDCCLLKRSNRSILEQLRPPSDVVVKGGRALVMPIWAGSYERVLPPAPDPEVKTDREQQAALLWFHDISTTLDYLESRADIDMSKAGFLGISQMALAGNSLAIEKRLKVGVLISAGVNGIRHHPMSDIVNYAPRIKIPILMINGRFDFFYPYEQSQKRLFDLLGTPANQKRHVVYDVGHFEYAQPNSIAMEVSNWLDQYLGVVQ